MMRSRSLTGSILVSGVAALTTVVGGLALSAPGASASPHVAPPHAARIGSTASVPAGATNLGALAPATELRATVTLRPAHPAALAAYAAEVSTPDSSLHRRYLTPSQFVARFAPTSAEVATVRRALAATGVHVGAVTADHLSMALDGTSRQFSRAFSTGFDTYRLVGGRIAYANTVAPLLPAAAAGAVQGVIGLSNLTLPHRESLDHVAGHVAGRVTPHVVTGGPQPCSAAKSAGTSNDSYTADQLASAYSFSSLYGAGDEGAGQTVALYELEPNLTADIAAYQSCYGTSATVSYVKVDSGAGSGAGEGEAALDIEDVIGLAPKASVKVYQGPNSDSGAYDTYNSIISQDSAKVVSTSWGQCESTEGSSAASSENTLFEEAATQGQTIVAAAGDDGSEDCGTSALAVDDPASQPYITGVGGTSLTAIGPPPTEKVWDDTGTETGAGGGGVSTLWKMPTYQSGAPSSLKVVNANSSATPCGAASGSYCREVPDVSADADPYTGYVVYYDGSWSGIGGTSAAAPLWAAFIAVTNASSSCNGTNVGFANTALYKVAASGYSSDFHDITSGNNDYTQSHSGKFPAGADYDMASGLGTPNGANLPVALCGGGGTQGNTVTVTNPGTQTSTVGTSVSLQITASDSASGQTLSYSATGLPAGLSISATTGVVSGTPTTAGTTSAVVTARDGTGATGSAAFSWTVDTSGGGSCTAAQLFGNPGFETGSAAPWSATSGVISSTSTGAPAHSGSYLAWLDGYGTPTTDTLSQTVTVPAACTSDTLSFWLYIDTSENSSSAVDTLNVQLLNTSGTVLSTLKTYSNLNTGSGYVKRTFTLSGVAGTKVNVKFTGKETDKGGGTTDFFIDDTAFQD